MCLPAYPTDLPLHPVLTRAADILQYHLVLGESLRARDIEEGETQLETALGKDITVVKKGKAVSIKLVSRARGLREIGRGGWLLTIVGAGRREAGGRGDGATAI